MEKGRLGEEAFKEALSEYPVFMSVAYGTRQNDIDHLVLTDNSVIMNECKNINKDFFMWYSWFSSHVIDRFADGLPIAQYYARTFGYPIQKITFTLTIPYLRTEPIVRRALKGLKIHLIETGKQLLRDEDKRRWYSPVRRQILSVINSITLDHSYFSREKQHRNNNHDRQDHKIINSCKAPASRTNAGSTNHREQTSHVVVQALLSLPQPRTIEKSIWRKMKHD